jgi:hypothetical protein
VSPKFWAACQVDGEESAAANAEPGLERCISLLKLVLKRGILNDSAPGKMENGSIVIISWAVPVAA